MARARESVDSPVADGSLVLLAGNSRADARNRRGFLVKRLKLHDFVNLADRAACNEKGQSAYLCVCTGFAA